MRRRDLLDQDRIVIVDQIAHPVMAVADCAGEPDTVTPSGPSEILSGPELAVDEGGREIRAQFRRLDDIGLFDERAGRRRRAKSTGSSERSSALPACSSTGTLSCSRR